jgi:cellulose synthase/poly-beta-1,6-N-acetylglucosamine synthase-like glycosyltransferase
MEYIFWTFLAIILYTYFGYPLAIMTLSLVRHERVEKRNSEPAVTLIITAFNEEKDIRRKLENALALDFPRDRFEIIVASDGSNDRTDDIVREYATRGVVLYAPGERLGKTEMQNRAVRIAHGEILVFSDATTQYERSALRMIVRNFADPAVGAVSGRFKYLDPGATQIGRGTGAFWDYESFIKMRQTKIGTITGCSGCIYALRRVLFMPLPPDIISDLVEPLAILEKGYRIVYEPEALAYERSFQTSAEEFGMRVRVITRGMHGLVYMRRLLNPFRYGFVAFQLISHKVLRWLVPLFAVALYVVNLAILDRGAVYYLFFCLQTGFFLCASTGWLLERSPRKIRAFSLPFYFCVINTASVVAMLHLLLNRKIVKWKTVRT